MSVELIKSGSSFRMYQLDFKVKKIFGVGVSTIKDLWKADPLKFQKGYELAEDVADSVNKICISDAHTHVERLVFPAFNVRDKTTGEVFVGTRCNTIDGKTTMMIFGGDINSVHSDETYIRHLRVANRTFNHKEV